MAKTKLQKLRSQADKLWFRAYLKDSCEVCGARGKLVGHHFYYRGSYGHLRYDKNNHTTLCRSCHFVLHSQDPKKITEKIIEKRGRKWYNDLKAKSKKRPNGSYLSTKYYEDNIIKLNKYLNGSKRKT